MKLRLPREFGKNALIVAALVAAGFFAAWLRFREYLGTESAFTDGVHEYDPKDFGSVRYAVWDAPVRLPRANPDGASESQPALSPDGRFLVFVVGERGANSELYIAELASGAPVDAKPLAALNSSADDLAPAFSNDALYFASDRAGGLGGLDLYRASYSNGEFGSIEALAAPLNSAADDTDAAPRPGSTEIVFASNREGANFDLYRFDPAAPDAARAITRLDALDTRLDECEPAFTADGRTLFFASNRNSGTSDFDLFRASSRDGEWSAPLELSALDTRVAERSPRPAVDDFSLYFAREQREGSQSQGFELWRARSLELFRLPGRPVGWIDLLVLASLLVLALLVWLAKRWPKLELVYKCYLVSLIAHLLFFWLSRGWFSDPGARGGEHSDGGGAIESHFSLDLRSSIAGGSRGGGGRGDGEPATRFGTGSSDAPSKAFSASLDGGVVGASTVSFEAPSESAPSAPEPRAIGLEAVARANSQLSAANVAVASGAAIERRGGEAPTLDLGAPVASAERASSSETASGAPRRRAGVGGGDARELPRGGDVVAAPSAPGALAPGARALGIEPGASAAGSASIALAAPTSDAPKLGGASAGGAGSEPAFALGELALGSGERTSPVDRGPARGGRVQRGDGTTETPAAPSSSSIATLAPSAPVDGAFGNGATGGSRASIEIEPGSASRAKIGLADGESIAKVTDASAPNSAGASGSNGAQSLIDSLGAAGAGASRASEVGPAKQSFGAQPSEHPGAPAPLALAAPDDRAKTDPVKPTKSWENTPYQNRSGEEKVKALADNGGSKETEAAVAKGLAYLARIQGSNGEWGDFDILDDKYGQVAVGKTGLALLAFLGAGHTHLSGSEYSDAAARALAFLLAVQDEASGHFGDSDAYSHGIATYAVAECYALTGEPQLREPLQRAVAHILSKQNHARDPRLFGGWSYYYRDQRTFDRWPRTSITVWQVMALESARLSGVDVPEQVFDDAAKFIQNARDEENGWYRYNHDPSRLNSSWPTLPASTPAALFALSLVGKDLSASEFDAPKEFVLSRTPTAYRRGSEDEFVSRGQGNLYFWYYGTLSMFRAGGSAWKRWNASMKDTLVRGQRKDGSWDPIDVYCQYAHDDARDKSYSTAMCVLSLEVYYRYYLPLLKIR